MPSRIVTVGTTPVQLLDIMPCRKQYLIQNQDLNINLFIDETDQVSTSGTRTGRILWAMGLESANNKDDPAIIAKPMYGVVASGSITVWVFEE
jgi:hypothetical protein